MFIHKSPEIHFWCIGMSFFAPTNTVAVKFWLCIHGYMAFWFSLLQNRKVLSNYLRRISSHLHNNGCSARGLKVTKILLGDKCCKKYISVLFPCKGDKAGSTVQILCHVASDQRDPRQQSDFSQSVL